MPPKLDIVTPEVQANQETVDLLRRLLALAESGDLISILICGRLSDERVMTEATSDVDFVSRLGMIEAAKLDWVRTWAVRED